MKLKGVKRFTLWFGLGLVLAVAGIAGWLGLMLRPVEPGIKQLVRFEGAKTLGSALLDLEKKGVVRSARAIRIYATLVRREKGVGTGTYSVQPGMTASEILDALEKPIKQMVRIPETNWSRRTANYLEQKGVVVANAYLNLVQRPKDFQDAVSFPLPKFGTLEGYLYPDTYDLPPMLGARQVILRQLKAFETKVIPVVGERKDMQKVLTVASMVEMEVMKDNERPIVAGVIFNRLAKGMRLQIDATINFALQVWRPLTLKDLTDTDSPYNTYRVAGLPPGPICSPSLKSIEAAVHPAKHDYLYYVAMPDGHHLFSKTYEEHLANIAKRKAALAAAKSKP